jgi:anti-sigma factor RsiW
MTMALDDDTLQRFYDGALSPDEERSVRAEVETSPSAQERLAELARFSDLMRGALLSRAHELDSDVLFRSIETGIAEDQALGLGARLRVLGSEWLEHKKGVIVPALASMAVAAAALLTFLAPHGTVDPGVVLPEDSAPLAALVHGSSIENVDFGQSTGTVFEVESEGVRAAVVWIAEDDEEAP